MSVPGCVGGVLGGSVVRRGVHVPSRDNPWKVPSRYLFLSALSRSREIIQCFLISSVMGAEFSNVQVKKFLLARYVVSCSPIALYTRAMLISTSPEIYRIKNDIFSTSSKLTWLHTRIDVGAYPN